MGLFSFITDIFDGGKKAKAAKQAADAQVAAAQHGIDAITAQNTLTDQNLAPYLEGGTKALGAQSDLLGLNGGDSQDASIKALQDSPLYKSLFQTGQNTVLANASATGGLRGGNVQNSLARFGSDTLASVIQNQLQNLGGISSQGAQVGLGEGQLGASAATNIASLFGNQGNAQAAGILGKLTGHLQQDQGVTGVLTNLLGNLDFTGGGQPAAAGNTNFFPGQSTGTPGGNGGGIVSSLASLFQKFI